jgi:hypothetical protein
MEQPALDTSWTQGQERNRSDTRSRGLIRADVRTEGLAVIMSKIEVEMLERLCRAGEVLDELKHNLKVTPDGAVTLSYITERLDEALGGTSEV